MNDDYNSDVEMTDEVAVSLSIMFCWGNCADGRLGLGELEEINVLEPREVKFNQSNTVKSISCGKKHTLLLTYSGEVYSCGLNDYGQLGHNKGTTKFQLVSNLEAYKIKDVACGENHSLALNLWGEVLTWGSNSHGQLGQGNTKGDFSKPKVVRSLALNYIVQIAAGYHHCLALTNKGELFAWGNNEYGQLGIGLKTTKVETPVVISSLFGLPISLISCGSNHSFVTSKSGAVYGWGKNHFGQLGLNTETNYFYPAQLKTLRSIKVRYIVCGEDFSVFLTLDGGVLTCGAGQYGQLGHGSNSNEILPRKVLELMGSTVTQVCCGRAHTLAYLPQKERVYAFGLGKAGQLGTKMAVDHKSPQLVHGPWLENNKKLKIDKIYSGGDQCFVTVHNNDKKLPADFRVLQNDTQIWTLTLEKMIECQKVGEKENVNQDLINYLETVASSACCLNSSFLLDHDNHFCCTSKHPGIDMKRAQDCFTAISRTQNASIKTVIADAVGTLIASLPESPPDVETLRLYLVLPMYHEFDNPRHASKIQGPYARSILRLKPEACKIVENWLLMQTEDYFERIVRVYKNIVLLMLQNTNMTPHNFDLMKFDPAMCFSLQMLEKLAKINNYGTSRLVNYETFHMPEIPELIDVRLDYLTWALDKSGKKMFCHYPFLFDASAKMLLLEADQSMQMQLAVSEATHRAVTMLLLTATPVMVEPILELTVSRDNLIQDTITQLTSHSEQDLKKPLRITFRGEEAEDAGGVRKEFFLLLMKEVLDPKYGMFVNNSETNTIWFSEDTFEQEIMYYLVGLLCGLAIYNFTIINLPFPLVLYKKLLNEPVGLDDLKDYSPSLAKGLKDLLEYEADDIEDVFFLRFEISRDSFGQIKTSELKPDGSNISVTQENKKEYVDLYIDYVFNKSIETHFRAFHDAFHKVCGGRVLQLFHAEELMAVVVGNENYDWDMLENNTVYKNGYTSSDPTIRMFWETFHELPISEKKKFLMFLTGTDRIPILGMKAIKIIIQATNNEKFLPVAHTCFNLLDLPRYKTKERLKYKLLQAIQHTQGFSLV